jgi:hypothetical protein
MENQDREVDEMFRHLLSYKSESPNKIFDNNIIEGRIAMKVKSNVKSGAAVQGLVISS